MKYIKGFDTLRAFSIIFVLLTHLGLYNLLPENDYLQQRVWPLISGSTGVRIFFTLSGFLITRILLNEFQKYSNINFLNFYIRRFLRLLPPLMIFYIAVGVLMSKNMIESNVEGFIFSFFYLYNFISFNYYTAELGHTWSLALEEQYYLIWPLIINYLRRKTILLFVFTILVLCIVAVYTLPLFNFTKSFNHNRWFIPAVAPIIVGSLSALLLQGDKNHYIKYFKKKRAMLLIGLLLFVYPLYSPFLNLSFIIQSVGVSFILTWILCNQESKFVSILDLKLLSYIGKISYGIYVYQGLFLRTAPGGELWIQQFPQNIILTMLAAIISFELVEKPILRLKKKFKRNESN